MTASFSSSFALYGARAFVDQRGHRGIRGQQIGEDRQQLVAEVGDLAALDVEVEHGEELAVAAGVGDERAPAAVGDDRRRGHAVVRVAAEDRVDAAHARGELQVDVHPVVRQQHDRLRALAARLVDDLLQALVLDAERPVGDEVARIGDRRVRKRLPDDRDRHAVDGPDRVRRKHRVAEVGGLDVLREELDLAGEVPVDDLLHAVGAEREFPVPGHHVDAQQLAGVDHVLALRPQRGGRALPRVAAVEQQRAAAATPSGA